eukprot:jgi/Chlat1/1144/Chrsp112S01621
MALLAASCALLLFALSSLTLTDAFAGQSLRPLNGVCYSPAPSDYRVSSPGPYWSGDYANADFAAMWGPKGRDDIGKMRSDMRFNSVRLYQVNPTRDHKPFMDYARSRGMKVLVPISNWYVLNDANWQQNIAAIVNSLKSHSANAMWVITNEITLDPACRNSLYVCLRKVMRVVKLVSTLDPSSRPISVASIFDSGFASQKLIKGWMSQYNMAGVYNARYVATINMYFFKNYAPTHGAVLTNVLDGYFKDSVLKNTPLVIGEWGLSSLPTPSVFSGTQQQCYQSSAGTLASAMTGSKYPRFLGSFAFEYSDELWKTQVASPMEAHYGLHSIVGYTTAKTTSGQTYRVDTLVPKSACKILADANRRAGF